MSDYKNFLYSLPELLPTYVGGQIEIQGIAKGEMLPHYVFRGEIKNIGLKDVSVVVEMSWVAEMVIGTGKWKFAKIKPYAMDLRLYSVVNIGPGREGSDRIHFNSDAAEELVVLFPPDGSKLDLERVEGTLDTWGDWSECDLEEEELKRIAGTSEGVKVFRNNLYQVIVRSIMPKGDCVDQLLEMVWLSIKSIDQSATHDWRHFQRIKNELVGPECEGVELYPAESRMVDTSNQYHLFVLKDSKMTFPFGFRERIVIDDGEVCQSIGAKQRPFEKGWTVSFTDTSLVVDKLKEIMRIYEEKKEED